MRRPTGTLTLALLSLHSVELLGSLLTTSPHDHNEQQLALGLDGGELGMKSRMWGQLSICRLSIWLGIVVDKLKKFLSNRCLR